LRRYYFWLHCSNDSYAEAKSRASNFQTRLQQGGSALLAGTKVFKVFKDLKDLKVEVGALPFGVASLVGVNRSNPEK
jgi:hypothetical protein